MRQFIKYAFLLFVGYQVGYFIAAMEIPKDILTQNRLMKMHDDLCCYYKHNGKFPEKLSDLNDSHTYGKDGWGHDVQYVKSSEGAMVVCSEGRRISSKISYNISICVVPPMTTE